jgi:hypothetical protein
MTSIEPQPTSPPPHPPLQFRLRTLLLLCVVLGSSLAVFGAWGIVVFALVGGLAIYLRVFRSLASIVCLVVGVPCLMCLLALPAFVEVERMGRQSAACLNRAQQIALALQEYHKANGCFPPAYIADKTGKPMHSWRVLLLPYLEENALYQQYNFNEPWNGPNNKQLFSSRPLIYACPRDPNAFAPGASQASYFAVVGPNAAWTGDKPRKMADLSGEASNTIMIVEAANTSIPWSEPKDLLPDVLGLSGSNASALGPSSNHGAGSQVTVAMADGNTRWLTPRDLSRERLRKILQIGGFNDKEGDTNQGSSVAENRSPNWPNIAALAVWLLSVATLLVGAVRGRKRRAA